jgi:glycosyltransferase involved in cell wall biosynthesis
VKILLITLMPPSRESSGAIAPVLHATVTGLCLRHDVTVLALVDHRDELGRIRSLCRPGLQMHGVVRSQTTGWAGLPRRGRMAMSWLLGEAPKRGIWFHEPAMQQAIDRVTAHQQFAIIQAEDSASGSYRFPAGTPRIVTEHEVRRPRAIDRSVWRGPHAAQRIVDELDWQRWQPFQASIWRRFDRVQVFSPRDAAAVAAIVPDMRPRVRINPFAIDLPVADSGQHEVPGTVLFAGNFLHRPNVDAAEWLVRDILPLLRQGYPGVRVTLAGTDPRGAIRGLAADDVTVAGFVPDLEGLLARSAVVVAPVRIGGGQRMKVLHSMAAGKAVVTTGRGAEGVGGAESARQGLCTAEDAASFAATTLRLLHSPEERRALGRRARALVEAHHTPDAYARRQEAIYEELVGASERGAERA